MKKISPILVLLMLIAPLCFAASDDKTDRLSQNSGVFSPGYVNAAKYQADSLLKQTESIENMKTKGFMEQAMDYVKDKLGRKNEEQAAAQAPEIAGAELQRKTSQQNASNPAATIIVAGGGVRDPAYDIQIGKGTSQFDVNGNPFTDPLTQRLGSEIIDGKRYIYAGFNNVGTATIQEAVDRAYDFSTFSSITAIVVVREGVYDGEAISLDLAPSRELNIYGGYGEDGTRDIAKNPTIINGYINITGHYSPEMEISGFTINDIYNQGAITISNVILTLENNTIYSNLYGVLISNNANVVAENNNFTGSCGMQINGFYSLTQGHNRFNGGGGGAQETGPAASTVSSSNNNFGTEVGISVDGTSNISSNNDYFSGTDWSGTHNGRVTINSYAPVPNIFNAQTTAQDSGENSGLSFLYSGLTNPYTDTYGGDEYIYHDLGTAANMNKESNQDALVIKFKTLLIERETVISEDPGAVNPVSFKKILENSATPVATDNLSPQQIEAAKALGNILSNPTDDQKIAIDSVTSLLNDIENIQKEPGSNPELAKASSDLLAMVANVLLAQGIPDLLKEGDMQAIKGIFANLDSAKSKMLSEYNESTKPYYDEVKKILEKNASAIDLNLKNTLEKELKDAPRSEIDKIIEKLKAKEKRNFEEDYILQQEAKYRKDYLDPNKKKLESSMKAMMEDFTKKLSATLETKKK